VTARPNLTASAALEKALAVEARLDAAVAAQPGTWQSYTPTWTIQTLGASVPLGRWCQAGGLVIFMAQLTAGSGTSLGSGDVRCTLPTTPAGNGIQQWVPGAIYDGTNWYALHADIVAGNANMYVRALRTSSTSAVAPLILLPPGTSPSPLTWATGAIMSVGGTYESS